MSTTTNTTTDVGAAPVTVPAHIPAALKQLRVQQLAAFATRANTHAEHAARSARIALAKAREAAWWGVLARWTSQERLPWVYSHAAAQVRVKLLDDAWHYRQESIAAWQASQAGQHKQPQAGRS